MSRPEPAELELFPSSRATRSSGSVTRSSVEPSTNSPGWRMNASSSVDLDELGEVLLLRLDVDERVAGVAEHAEVAVDAHVEARRLHERRLVRIDADAALVEEAADGAIGEDHAAILRGLR